MVAGADKAKVSVQSVDARTVHEGRMVRKDIVGVKKNGYGMELAGVFATNDIPKQLVMLLRKNLGRAAMP